MPTTNTTATLNGLQPLTDPTVIAGDLTRHLPWLVELRSATQKEMRKAYKTLKHMTNNEDNASLNNYISSASHNDLIKLNASMKALACAKHFTATQPENNLHRQAAQHRRWAKLFGLGDAQDRSIYGALDTAKRYLQMADQPYHHDKLVCALATQRLELIEFFEHEFAVNPKMHNSQRRIPYTASILAVVNCYPTFRDLAHKLKRPFADCQQRKFELLQTYVVTQQSS